MGIESKANHVVERIKSPLFVFSVFLVHIFYITVFLGIAFINENYIRYLSTMIQAFVAIFLTIRFNPFNNQFQITAFDKQIIFYSATFLLLNVVITEVYVSFIQSVETDRYIQNAKIYLNKMKPTHMIDSTNSI